jgi:hypothetical protein
MLFVSPILLSPTLIFSMCFPPLIFYIKMVSVCVSSLTSKPRLSLKFPPSRLPFLGHLIARVDKCSFNPQIDTLI